MRAWLVFIAPFACLLIGGLRQSDAAVVFSQPLNSPPNSQGGFHSDGPNSGFGPARQQIAEDFILASAAAVDNLQWFGAYNPPDPTSPKSFLIRFFTSLDTPGGPLPASLINEQSVSALGVDTGFNNENTFNILSYSANLAPVNLDAGTRYWISILENDPSTDLALWAWQFSHLGNDQVAVSTTNGSAWGHATVIGSPQVGMAFTLSADSPSAAVPEPASLALWGIGVVGVAIAAARRRRK
jgi:hypothetical protein